MGDGVEKIGSPEEIRRMRQLGLKVFLAAIGMAICGALAFVVMP